MVSILSKSTKMERPEEAEINDRYALTPPFSENRARDNGGSSCGIQTRESVWQPEHQLQRKRGVGQKASTI
jgi:hypothetical protein